MLRAGWIDSLLVTAIAGMIVVHAATAYILEIDWYYQERTTSELVPAVLGPPALFAALLGLGPLFLLAGLLSAASLGRKGPGGFARGRLVRLAAAAGVPSPDRPAHRLSGLARRGEHPRLWSYLADQTGARDTGPLWFVTVLLVLSLADAGSAAPAPSPRRRRSRRRARQLVAAAAAITAESLMVRLASPFAAETFSNLRWAAWPRRPACSPSGCSPARGDGWTRSTAAGCAAVGGQPSPPR
jgi:glucans biosynthesis protein C